MTNRTITDATRRRLWNVAHDCCAFDGCGQQLFVSARPGHETYVGEECHIIARADSPRVARSIGSLTLDERKRHAHRVEDRHGFDNLVLMCRTHARLIDDPANGFSVDDVVGMKEAHTRRVRAEQRRYRAEIDGGASPALPKIVVIEDIPQWTRRAIQRLIEQDHQGWEWFVSRLGEVPDPECVTDVVQQWPAELETASLELSEAVARTAEQLGLWAVASDVWEHRSDRRANASERADDLVRAAVDAGVGERPLRHQRLLERARDLDAESPRLVLESLDDVRDTPARQLEVLADLSCDDVTLDAIVCCARARAAMLLPDLDQAQRHLDRAKALDGAGLQVRATALSLEVQRGRLALRDDRPHSLARLDDAMREALELRKVFVRMRRFSESAQSLMLAADVLSMKRDGAGATRLLAKALDEEIRASWGAEVLGDCALRAGADDLALSFTKTVPLTEAVRRIRATAQIAVPRLRPAALAELETLARGGGSEADLAAYARLCACLPPVRASWSEEAAGVLAEGRHRLMVQRLRPVAAAAAGRHFEAEALAARLPAEPWAAEIRLRVAGHRGDRTALLAAAREFLSHGPDAPGRLLAGLAQAKGGDFVGAKSTLSTLAADVNAPGAIRNDAYAALVRADVDTHAWPAASRHFAEWQQVAWSEKLRPDGRMSALQVRVLHAEAARRVASSGVRGSVPDALAA